MGVVEAAERMRQETLKRLEQAGWSGQPTGSPCVSFPEWQAAAPSRFFKGATESATLLAAPWPVFRDEIIHTAERACGKRFNLLGYRDLSFGDPVDWHLDAVSGRRAPLVHWSRLDPLDSVTLGDSKVIWELNRAQWLVHIALAYRVTSEARYADIVARSIREWIEANPPGMGINWTSSLEVALRLIAWCWAAMLCLGADALSEDFFTLWLGSIRCHVRHLERYLSHYFSPNTHLTGEALGLFYAGVLFAELREANRWRRLGGQILVEQIERQVLPDGVYFEQSTCYQRYTIDIYLHFLTLAARNGVAVPHHVPDGVQRMLDFLLAVRRPDGSIPKIGDEDGGWLLPLTPRAPDDARGTFSLAAAFFRRHDYAWAGGVTPEALWMLGPSALESLPPAPPAVSSSQHFPAGGYAVMRNSWDEESHQLVLDAGPIGCPFSAGHGHADLLSLQCSAFGEPFIVDPGTYCYTAQPTWRESFRTTTAHSTITVDGVGQAASAGPFAWRSRPRVRLRRWLSNEALDFADAEHDAYRHLADPVTHRRRVLFVKPHYWLVVDDLGGAAEHRIELHFQFAPMAVTLDADLWVRTHGPRGHGLLLRTFAAVPLKGEVLEGHVDPPRGWVSPAYGQRQPAPMVVCSAVVTLPFRLVTLLWPTRDSHGPVPGVRHLEREGSSLGGLVLETSGERILFNEPQFVVERG
jgi:hypothetical protein